MKVIYKNATPEVVLSPHVLGIFNYISKNIDTNLFWLCVVQKKGNKYYLEDVYFPEQNVNKWMLCDFNKEEIKTKTNEVCEFDNKPMRFNCLGRHLLEKSSAIDETCVKYFQDFVDENIDEFLMVQVNQKGEFSFAVNRKANILTDLDHEVDLDALVNSAILKGAIDSKIGKYTYYNTANFAIVPPVVAKCLLLKENKHWKGLI